MAVDLGDRGPGSTQLVKGRFELTLDLCELGVAIHDDFEYPAPLSIGARSIEQPVPVPVLLRMHEEATVYVKDHAAPHRQIIAGRRRESGFVDVA